VEADVPQSGAVCLGLLALTTQAVEMKKRVSLLGMILLPIACQPDGETGSRFCINSPSRDMVAVLTSNNDEVYIDIVRRELRASDTTDVIELSDQKQYFGMIKPLPLLVPKLTHLQTKEVVRVADGPTFLVFTADGSHAGQYIGQMYKKGEDGRTFRILSYRYTLDGGVYEIRTDEPSGVSSSPLTLVKCGGPPLLAQTAI
jgi:hypothetical protein